jgi:hypothetical protein
VLIDIVRVALRRPYTFVVMALLLLIAGPLAALRTPTDIFPDIKIPVIAVAWQYTGQPPDQMAGRISTQFQRADHHGQRHRTHRGQQLHRRQHRQDLLPAGRQRGVANAQVTAISQALLKQMPAGSRRR